jgi:hypothetical protein
MPSIVFGPFDVPVDFEPSDFLDFDSPFDFVSFSAVAPLDAPVLEPQPGIKVINKTKPTKGISDLFHDKHRAFRRFMTHILQRIQFSELCSTTRQRVVPAIITRWRVVLGSHAPRKLLRFWLSATRLCANGAGLWGFRPR